MSFTTINIQNAIIKKSTTDWMKAPYFTTALQSVYSSDLKSTPPVSTHTSGMIISPTIEDDDSHSEIYDIAFHGKFFEFLEYKHK